VRVGGALAVAVGQAALQHLPAGWVQRHWVRALAEPDRPGAGVGIFGAQVPDFSAGGSVQQGEDAQKRLVRVGIGAGCPAAEQGALLVKGDGLAGEAPRCGGGQAPGGVGQDNLLAPGETERSFGPPQDSKAANRETAPNGGDARLGESPADHEPLRMPPTRG
jgi:hypothetical protein